ncbi:MAG: histidine kinase, partial [Bacteroidetes bacterium]|nr:histidine kinase [Bacteroidota bacterium]
EELGLITSIKNLCHEFKINSNIKVDFVSHGISELISIKQKTYIYRICQEALSNIQKHADASEVNVQLLGNNEQLTLIIQDNGKGFSYDIGYYTKGNGLNNIRDRAEILNGSCEIESTNKQGTNIKIRIPLEKKYAKDNSYSG